VEDGGGYPRNKISYSLGWTMNNLTVNYLGEFIDGMTVDGSPGFSDDYRYQNDALNYHDLTGSFAFSQGTTISGGVTNITDEAPPFMAPGFNGATSPEMYRMLGRGYYIKLSHEFQ
jgi:outer membrane receptor protein involved in Fe transport